MNFIILSVKVETVLIRSGSQIWYLFRLCGEKEENVKNVTSMGKNGSLYLLINHCAQIITAIM